MRTGSKATLTIQDVQLLHRECRWITDAAEQIDLLLDALPQEGPIRATYPAMRASAERVLRDGVSLNVTTIFLAARLLDRRTGLPLLAETLRSDAAYQSWGATTVGDLVGAFRGVSPQLTRRIATAARMAPGTEIAGCRPTEIALLAEQLDSYAKG